MDEDEVAGMAALFLAVQAEDLIRSGSSWGSAGPSLTEARDTLRYLYFKACSSYLRGSRPFEPTDPRRVLLIAEEESRITKIRKEREMWRLKIEMGGELSV